MYGCSFVVLFYVAKSSKNEISNYSKEKYMDASGCFKLN